MLCILFSMAAIPPNSLGKFLTEAKEFLPDADALTALHPQVVADLSAFTLPAAVVGRLIDAVDEIGQIAAVHGKAWANFSVLRNPGFEREHSTRRSMLDLRIALLTPYVRMIGLSTHKPDGYLASELCHDAIGRDLWRKILADSGLGATSKGGQNRRFSNSAVRTLANAADRIGSKKCRDVARRWRELVPEVRA